MPVVGEGTRSWLAGVARGARAAENWFWLTQAQWLSHAASHAGFLLAEYGPDPSAHCASVGAGQFAGGVPVGPAGQGPPATASAGARMAATRARPRAWNADARRSFMAS